MQQPQLPKEFVTAPAVFAVEDTYQILLPMNTALLFWVTIGGETYYDHSNGILRSDTRVHRVTVPMRALDNAGEYTVCWRRVIERKAYYTVTEETQQYTCRFYPVRTEGAVKLYHLSDTHGELTLAAQAGNYFNGDIDLLILNGDIMDHSGEEDNFLLIFRLCSAITGGEHPCVFARGNHDLRGYYAERLADYTPALNGKSYYTFRLGRIWGLVLDCGEDKADGHEEYGHTVACEAFRREENAFLEAIAEQKAYSAEDIQVRLVIVHTPFLTELEEPYNIETALYRQWAALLAKRIKPDLFLAGHLHDTCIMPADDERPFPVIIGSRAIKEHEAVQDFIGCALTLQEKSVTVAFTDSAHRTVAQEELTLS